MMTRVRRKLEARLNKVLRGDPSGKTIENVKRVQKMLRREAEGESPNFHRVQLLVRALEMMSKPKTLVAKVADMKRQLASKKLEISELKKRLKSQKVMGAEEYRRTLFLPWPGI
jgi:predicted RNase H-like nuclease (RuvC/YqgF family)